MATSKTSKQIRMNERDYVEKPLLEQLEGLGWEVLDLKREQKPAESFRESFAEVVMSSVLREQLKVINPWLEDDQVSEVVKGLTESFPTNSLLENNRYVHTLLLENTSVAQNRQTGAGSPTVRFIDFNELSNNRFIAVCQFKVRILGSERHIIPDVALFLNGLPVVVIECKSPKVKDALPEAIDQLLRYSQQRLAKGEGSPPLFFYNQFVVATCRHQAKFGTLTCRNEKQFYRWADPYPKTVNDLAHGSSSPNDQQRLVAGMLSKQNLLDLMRTFTIFSTNDKGQLIKIVGRYQQFRAVKVAVQRLLTGKSPNERSGIIWHTQGSGKSLTMMFMVREMYHHAQLSQWKIVFVTDRTQLEEQLSRTGQGVGFTIKVASSINKLKQLLRTDSSDLVMAMIHKFQEKELKQIFPQLNASPHILIMTDEAHRSQYSLLGSNLDKALPNATRIGYTGTPIDKTERVFGDYIDKYTMRQSIEDGVTLEIVYEGRTNNADILDQSGMDAAFEDVFSDYNLIERLNILRYGSRKAYLEARSIIARKAKDMVGHYLTHVFPNGFKAQIVVASREAAVRYKEAIDQALAESRKELESKNSQNLDLALLARLRSDVVISGSHNDRPHIKQYTNRSQQQAAIKSFKLPFDNQEGNVGIIIVKSMLLTGFDAPIEQVMYLDQVIKKHNLLQAIARVNRVAGPSKEKGFVIDYVGIGHHLKEAIDIYDEKEQNEILASLSSLEDEQANLYVARQAIFDLLAQYELTDLSDHDAFFDLFYDEDIRYAYIQAFNALTRALNLLYPAKEAQDYIKDYQALTQINVLANRHFYDERLSMKGVPAKLRALTDQYLKSEGISLKVAPISILDDKFESQVGQHKRIKTKAAAVEHAIRHHLEIELDDDPDLAASFAEALAKIFEEFENNWQIIHQELEKLRQRIKKADQEPTYGLHKKKQMPFFRMFKRELFKDDALNDDQIAQVVNLTQNIYAIVERELKLTGFWQNHSARNKLKSDIQKCLLSKELKILNQDLFYLILNKREYLISRIMELAKKNNDRILFAP